MKFCQESGFLYWKIEIKILSDNFVLDFWFKESVENHFNRLDRKETLFASLGRIKLKQQEKEKKF